MLPEAVVRFGRQWLPFAFVGFVVSAESLVMLMYQVNMDLLSTNPSLHIVVRLIHVHPQLSRQFQFDHKVCCNYLCTPICPDPIGLHPNRDQVHIEGRQNKCRMQRLPEGV